jgi:hypothetical protein
VLHEINEKEMLRTRDAEPELEVLVVVREVVLLHFAHVRWEGGVVEAGVALRT